MEKRTVPGYSGKIGCTKGVAAGCVTGCTGPSRASFYCEGFRPDPRKWSGRKPGDTPMRKG